MIRELTEPVQTIYFARRWRVLKDIAGEKARLRELLDVLHRLASAASGRRLPVPSASRRAGERGPRPARRSLHQRGLLLDSLPAMFMTT